MRPDIYLLVLDTARVKGFSCYGAAEGLTPNIDAFAKDAVLYRHAYSPACWTIPAHASLFTGALPSRHGTHGGNLFLSRTRPLLQTLLKDGGYKTSGVSANMLLNDHLGFTRGFDRFFRAWRLFAGRRDQLGDEVWLGEASGYSFAGKLAYILRRFPSRSFADPFRFALNRLYERTLGDVLRNSLHATRRAVDKACEIAAGHDSPKFVFLNVMEPHLRYTPPKSDLASPVSFDWKRVWNGRWSDYYTGKARPDEGHFKDLAALYEGEMRCTDRSVGKFLDRLKAAGGYDSSMVIITSDHGETIGEHGHVSHMLNLHEELIHVPLIIKYPKGMGITGVSDDIVQTHDIFATALEVAGFAAPGATDSVSLLSGRKREYVVSQLISNEYLLAELEIEGRTLGPRFDTGPVFTLITKNLKKIVRRLTKRGDGCYFCDGILSERSELMPARKIIPVPRPASCSIDVYDLSSDPGELSPLPADAHPELMKLSEDAITETGFADAVNKASREGDASVAGRLRALGYM